MKKVCFSLLIAAVGILSFSPTAAQSQEGSPSQQQNQSAPAAPIEGNPAENALPEPANSNQPAPLEQGGQQPAPEGEQAEMPSRTMDELYAQLEQSLNGRNWQQADQTTYELMLLIAGPKSEEQGYFDRAEWESFPCEQFQRIDALWSEASQGQQGFAAQLTIFQEVQDTPSTYFSRIGWQQDGKWLVRWQYNRVSKRAAYLPGMQPNFAEPPAGHLPALLQWSGGEDYRLAKANSCLVK